MSADPHILAELEHLHSTLTNEDRELLLEELLTGYAAGGAGQMWMMLNEWLLDLAGREWLGDGGRPPLLDEGLQHHGLVDVTHPHTVQKEKPQGLVGRWRLLAQIRLLGTVVALPLRPSCDIVELELELPRFR